MPLLARSAADRRSAPVWRGRTCADDLNDNELRYLHNADNARVLQFFSVWNFIFDFSSIQ